MSLFSWYHSRLSPYLHAAMAPFTGSFSACRFTPTCSQYAHQALRQYGIITGSFLALRRLLRCHPWAAGGHDPLPPPPHSR